MIKQLRTIDDLRLEQQRLRKRKQELEGLLQEDFALIREDLKPGNIIRNSLNSISNFDGLKGNDVINTAVTMSLNFLVTKVLMRKSGILKQLIATFLLRKYGVEFVDKNSDDIVDFIKNIITKFSNRKRSRNREPIYDSGTAGEDY